MSILAKVFDLRPGGRPSGTSATIKSMRVRPAKTLMAIRNEHGSAFGAALNGALNAEEYLKLECDDDE